MDDTERDFVRNLELKIASLNGELMANAARLASLEASDEQHRIEFEATRAELAGARVDLEHLTRRAREQKDADQRRCSELEIRLAEAIRESKVAIRERSAVIAALGRRARKQLGATSDMLEPAVGDAPADHDDPLRR